jgi:hypothetical protein
MPNPIQEQITQDLKQAKTEGQLRAERVREIVRQAVSQVAVEVKEGSIEIRTIVKDALTAAIAGLRESGGELQENLTASMEGVIAGISSSRQGNLGKAQAEVQQLQAELETEEAQLQQNVEASLVTLEEAADQETSPDLKAAIAAALQDLRNSEEMGQMTKRYAQLQAQLALLKAHLAERYGGSAEDIKIYLDEAQSWYEQLRVRAEGVAGQVEETHARVEERVGKAGANAVHYERRWRQLLSELLHSMTEALKAQAASRKSSGQ